MTVERILSDSGAATNILHLSEAENKAIDEALTVIEQRAIAENAEYNKEQTAWWLYGILFREGIGKVVETAKTTPFQKKRVTRRAYC